MESGALLLELSRSTVVGAFALVRLLLPQSELTVMFSHLVRVWARAGEQAGQSSVCNAPDPGREGAGHMFCQLFSMTGEVKANSLFLLSPTASDKHLASGEGEC